MHNNEMALSPWQPLSGQRVRRIPSRSAGANASGECGVVKVCTVNVGTMVGRRREVVSMLARRDVDICCFQEVRYKNQGCTTVGTNEEKYKFWYSGNAEGTNGVGVMVRQSLADNVLEITRYGDRMMKIRACLGKMCFNIMSAYAPQAGRSAQEKTAFWEMLEDEGAAVPEPEGLIIGGDMNAHIGRDREGFEEVMGCYGFGDRNGEGEVVLQICKNHQLRILNTYFKKDREKLITYKSGNAATQIDYILMRSSFGVKAIDCKAIPGEECLTQHRMVRADVWVRSMKKDKKKGRQKMKIWKLRNNNIRDSFEERVVEKLAGEEGSWKKFQNSLLQAGKEICGMTSGKARRERETWWWNDRVQHAIKEKKIYYKKWQKTKLERDKILYSEKKRLAKREIAIGKKEAWEEWSAGLSTAEGRCQMFKIAKQMKRDSKDVQGAKYIKDESGSIQVEESEVARRWKEYFERLLKTENNNDIEELEPAEGPILEVSVGEVERAVRSMKRDKATGPSGVSGDLIRCAGKTGVDAMHTILNDSMQTGKTPDEWRKSTTITLYKGKGDALECGNYRGLRLLEHGMKIWEKVIGERLRKIVNISDCQFGFMAGRSTMDAIFIVRQLQEKYREKKRLYHIFVDL